MRHGPVCGRATAPAVVVESDFDVIVGSQILHFQKR